MRGMSAAGGDPHTAGPNTWLRRWGGGEKLKKRMKMKRARGYNSMEE